MQSTETDLDRRPIWRAAIRDAIGPLAAYFTPRSYSIGSVSLIRLDLDCIQEFIEWVLARLELGRAQRLVDLLKEPIDLTSSYRHEISDHRGEIRGKLHMQRLLVLRARSDRQTVPVIRAERFFATPENLLLSEALRLSEKVLRFWQRVESPERAFSHALLKDIERISNAPGLAELRSRPRPALRELVGQVKGRVTTGVVPRASIASKVADLFSMSTTASGAFEAAANGLSLIVSLDPAFEDRVFELLCLGWILRALRQKFPHGDINPAGLKASGGVPIFVAKVGYNRVELTFQTSQGTLPHGRWTYRRSGKPLRAIPDLLLTVSRKGKTVRHILDAKNRSASTASEVAYKLLGYKENLGISPYYAFGLYPSFGRSLNMKRLAFGTDQVVLLQLPLARGLRAMGLVMRVLTDGTDHVSDHPYI